jgi:hypothetical protein
MAGFNPRRAPVNDAIRKAARNLLYRDEERWLADAELRLFGNRPETQFSDDYTRLSSRDRQRLWALGFGKTLSPKTKSLKTVDVEWWRSFHGLIYEERATRLAAMADPARNSNEHERKVAAAALARLKAKAAPGLEEHERMVAAFEAATKQPSATHAYSATIWVRTARQSG